MEDMNSLALLLGELTLLEPTTAEQLLLLDRTAHYPVEWDSYTNLTAASLFQPSFIGLHPLLNTIAAMVGLHTCSLPLCVGSSVVE